MKLNRILFFLFFILVITSCKTVTQTGWKTNAIDIEKDIKENNKNGLIIFTISDSDDRSKYLLKEVFNQDFFKSASANFSLYNVNIVRDETKMSAKDLKQNYVLLSNYGVREVPYLCLMNSDGDVYHSELIPSKIKTTESFLDYLDSLSEKNKILNELKIAIENTEGVNKIKAIDEFFNKVYLIDSSKYNFLFEAALKSDPKNESGLIGKFLLAKAQIKIDELLLDKKYNLAIEEFKNVINSKMLSPEEEQATWCNIAYFASATGKDSKDEVIQYLQKAFSVAPKSKRAKDIKSDIEYLKGK